METKIALAIPTNRGVKAKTVLSLLNLVKETKYPMHIIVASEGFTISENRTYIVTQAIKNNCTHLLFVDDDMILPENTINVMVESGKDICGVVAHSRALPLMPVVEFFDDDKLSTADRLLGRREIPTELFKCKAVGGGVLFINLEVFNKIEKPWFSTETYDFGMTKMGEDSWFCRQATKAGYDIWCDGSLRIGHIGDYVY